METGSYGDGYRDARKHAAQEAQIAVRNAVEEFKQQVGLLAEDNRKMREALRYYAKNHYLDVNAGPWGVNSTDFGNVARAALGEEK